MLIKCFVDQLTIAMLKYNTILGAQYAQYCRYCIYSMDPKHAIELYFTLIFIFLKSAYEFSSVNP